MKIIDLTHYIHDGMPVYPGTKDPEFITTNTYDTDSFRETRLSMSSHTGTHIDAPAHIYKNAPTLDSFEVDQFLGKALVIDCRKLRAGEEIPLELIKSYGESAKEAEFLLFNTGWDKKWGTDEYFSPFPVLSNDAIDFIANGNYKGIGFDVVSIDQVKTGLKKHQALFSKASIINIESLKDLDLCGNKLFTLVCLPLNIKNADGSPARAIAIIE